MQSLLRWSIENSGSSNDTASGVAPPSRRTDLDPGIIDAILGRPDSELMKEALAKAQDAQTPVASLVENIDNANDLEKLGMWEPLQSLLASPSDDVKVQALWVIGTAVQNNPAAQKAYLALDPLPTVVTTSAPRRSPPTTPIQSDIRALGLLRHNAAAIAPFDAAGGWDALRGAFRFLLNSLLTPSAAVAPAPPPSTRIRGSAGGEQAPAEAPVHPNSHASMVADPASADTAPETLRALGTHGLLSVLVRELAEPTPYGPDGDKGDGGDADLEEKLTRLLHTYVSAHNGTFDGPERNTLRTFLGSRRAAQGEGKLGLGADELQVLENALV
ncbi:hypothetical protein BC826DRAFT_1044638 [Russula brevipes]|nr:hypothetical protein BC826DRAFT_1044638 [Russula brevipes]